jgi:hypothetical protein
MNLTENLFNCLQFYRALTSRGLEYFLENRADFTGPHISSNGVGSQSDQIYASLGSQYEIMHQINKPL